MGITYLFVAAATYYGASLVQVIFHRLFGHQRWIGALFETHVHGHHAQYAWPTLQTERWIPTERHIIWYYSIPFALVACAVYWLCAADLFAVHLAALFFSIWWHIYLHRQYHVRASWLSRFVWFRHKRQLHLLHHRRSNKNYAIVEFFWDRVLGTHLEWRKRVSRRG